MEPYEARCVRTASFCAYCSNFEPRYWLDYEPGHLWQDSQRCGWCRDDFSRLNSHRRYAATYVDVLRSGLTLTLDMVPLRDVAAWRSYVNIAATTGRSLGGPLGGYLTDSIGWRWCVTARPCSSITR
jgi:hypothetical protein